MSVSHDELVAEVTRFLTAGGRFTFTEWEQLSDELRNAAEEAGEAHAAAVAALTGLASRGPLEAAAVASGGEDDSVRVRAGLVSAVGKAAEKLSRAEVRT